MTENNDRDTEVVLLILNNRKVKKFLTRSYFSVKNYVKCCIYKTFFHSLSLYATHFLPLSLSLSFSLSIYLSLSHTLTLSLSHTHTLSHSCKNIGAVKNWLRSGGVSLQHYQIAPVVNFLLNFPLSSADILIKDVTNGFQIRIYSF